MHNARAHTDVIPTRTGQRGDRKSHACTVRAARCQDCNSCHSDCSASRRANATRMSSCASCIRPGAGKDVCGCNFLNVTSLPVLLLYSVPSSRHILRQSRTECVVCHKITQGTSAGPKSVKSRPSPITSGLCGPQSCVLWHESTAGSAARKPAAGLSTCSTATSNRSGRVAARVFMPLDPCALRIRGLACATVLLRRGSRCLSRFFPRSVSAF